MAKYYYNKKTSRKFFKIISLIIILAGAGIFVYVFFPLISWQIYFEPAFASQDIAIPIPKTTVVTGGGFSTLLANATNSLTSDLTNASNWYPNFQRTQTQSKMKYYLSIPKIKVYNLTVSNYDADLSKTLVQYNTDVLPPNKGNNIIFGHSTLPQLFDSTNYKTVFANLYLIEPGDVIEVNIQKVLYVYKVQSVTVVDADDTSVLTQNFGDSYITLITCTPPGTIWKRLVVRAKLENI